jgi:hypothetical protein
MCILCEGNFDYSITELICCSKICCSKAEIPKEFTQLTRLDCSFTKTKIPKEFIQLKVLYCYNAKITKIPKEFTQLTEFKIFRICKRRKGKRKKIRNLV